jgi:uncharacterized membrane protein YkoI
MTIPRFPGLNAFSLAAVLALGLTGAAYAQQDAREEDDCGPIQGTIQVADDSADLASLARITEAQAREAALAAVAGATANDVDLEEEDGFLVYEVDLVKDGREHDVYVDAGSGEVLCVDDED